MWRRFRSRARARRAAKNAAIPVAAPPPDPTDSSPLVVPHLPPPDSSPVVSPHLNVATAATPPSASAPDKPHAPSNGNSATHVPTASLPASASPSQNPQAAASSPQQQNRHTRAPDDTSPKSSPHLTRSPSLPQPPGHASDAHTARSRTDVGTTADTSIPQNMQPPLVPNDVTLTLPLTVASTAPLHAAHAAPTPIVSPPSLPADIVAPVALPHTPTAHSDRNRRLSLDGDLPPNAIRPDDRRDEHDDDDALSEGLFEFFPDAFAPSSIDVSACSKAGWEPVRAPMPSVPPSHTVEVRKENQDAFCVFAPFSFEQRAALPQFTPDAAAPMPCLPPHQQIFLGVFDGHGAEGRPIAHYTRDYISSMSRDAAANLQCGVRAEENGDGRERRGAATGDGSGAREQSSNHPNGVAIPCADAALHRARLDTLKAAFSLAERALTESDSGIDHVFSGTTAVVTWLFGREVYTAWTGDSRSVLGRAVNGDNGWLKYKAVELSYDQKPVRSDEKRRVKSAGGRIARWQRNMGPLRVWLPRDWTPGLAMTRSIGDTVLSEYGVSPMPEVTYTRMGPSDSFVVLASDGVWEFMTSQEVVDFVGRMRREGRGANEASEGLVREAVRRWRRNEVVVDDTTAVIMYMNWDEEDSSSGSAATHGGAGAGAVAGAAVMSNGGEGGASDKKGLGLSVSLGGAGETATRTSRPRKVFSRTRAKVALKGGGGTGVHLVSDDGALTDFVCRNDAFGGL